jgi:linoleoyl-CoA desaturase
LGHIVFYWAIPIYFVGFWPAIIGYAIMSATTGLLISIVFQLAHVVEITEFEDATEYDLTIEHEWAIHQIKTTANFATNNRIVSWFLGGLNFQVEHHLFPKISHIHYPKIQPIVKSVCERFGVEYLDYPTMRASIASHLRMMRYLGTA